MHIEQNSVNKFSAQCAADLIHVVVLSLSSFDSKSQSDLSLEPPRRRVRPCHLLCMMRIGRRRVFQCTLWIKTPLPTTSKLQAIPCFGSTVRPVLWETNQMRISI